MTLNLVPEAQASSTDSEHLTAEQPVDTENHSVSAPLTHESVPSETQSSHHIVLAPETITHIGSFPITNTMLTSWIVIATLIIISFLATRKMKVIPGALQNLAETVVESLYTLTYDVAHDKTKAFFPLIATFFLFILLGNWFGLLPGIGSITINVVEHGETMTAPLFRSINSDLNITLGLALISAALTHYFAVKYLGIGGYLQKWFALNPIMLFVGLLELVSEFTKIISLSFRLFGNIFAGEVVLTTISGLFAYIAPLPFYMLEVLVGVVQAAVFMMLTLVFMVVLSEKHEAH